MRVILYTGKGGVGKSTISAATAVRCARRGSRTLLVSSDLAHNVSDILDHSIGERRVEVEDNLTALEVDIEGDHPHGPCSRSRERRGRIRGPGA